MDRWDNCGIGGGSGAASTATAVPNSYEGRLSLANKSIKVDSYIYGLCASVYLCVHCDSIIESVDSISRDEPDSPLTQYITNAGISRARYTITHFKHHLRILRLISNRMSV